MKPPKILDEFEPKDLNFLEANSNYTYLNLSNGKRLISGYHLQYFEGLFDTRQFLRIDRSHLVNRAFIYCISKDGFIYLKNDLKLSIPRRRKAKLQEKYPNLFIKSKYTL